MSGPHAAAPTPEIEDPSPTVGRRSPVRTTDLRLVQRASALIKELGDDLDARLSGEQRAHERLRLLRETTNRITRTANDAVLAYQRASRSLTAALARPNADAEALAAMRAHLDAARSDVLSVLDAASRRYPPAAGAAEQAQSGSPQAALPGPAEGGPSA